MTAAVEPISMRVQSQLDVEVGRQLLHVVVDHGTDLTMPPLLLMNGIGARYELLQPFVDELSRERTVIRFDVPGIGKSPPAKFVYRLPGLSKRVARVLDQLGYAKVDVLGISWGGALAQQFAFTQSSRCRKLVLVSTATGAIMVPAHPKVLAKMITYRRYTDPEYLASVAHELYGGSMRLDPTAAIQTLRSHGPGRGSKGYMLQLAAGLGWTSIPFLPLLKQKTLILSGNDDPLIPVCNAHIMGKLIRRSKVKIYKGGHLSLVTEADEMAPKIEAFLDKES